MSASAASININVAQGIMAMHSMQSQILLSACLVVPLIGCGGSEDPLAREVYPASGVVTFKGKPIPDATVRLHPVDPPEDDKPVFSPRGRVDESGIYTLTTYNVGDGAPPGDYLVSVSWVGPLDGVSEDEEDRLKERLPSKYNFAESSGLKVTVKEGDNMLQEIALK